MCGIGAFQLRAGDGDPRRLAQALLRGLVIRGRDSAGLAWHDEKSGETYIQKNNIDGVRFANQIDQSIGRTCIIHTRYATLGSPKVMANNHPIDVQGVVGVHNGHITNHHELISKCKDYTRFGEVDTEGAFAYIMHGPKKANGLLGRLADIRGGAALMWLNTNGPSKYLHVARLTSSPLVMGKSVKGSVIFASTKAILEHACKQADIKLAEVTELAEGTYIRFKDSEIDQIGDVPQPEPILYAPRTTFSLAPKTSSGSYSGGMYSTQMDLFLQETGYMTDGEPLEYDIEDDLLAEEQMLDALDEDVESWLRATGKDF